MADGLQSFVVVSVEFAEDKSSIYSVLNTIVARRVDKAVIEVYDDMLNNSNMSGDGIRVGVDFANEWGVIIVDPDYWYIIISDIDPMFKAFTDEEKIDEWSIQTWEHWNDLLLSVGEIPTHSINELRPPPIGSETGTDIAADLLDLL